MQGPQLQDELVQLTHNYAAFTMENHEDHVRSFNGAPSQNNEDIASETGDEKISNFFLRNYKEIFIEETYHEDDIPFFTKNQ